MESQALESGKVTECAAHCVQDAASYAFSNGTDVLLTRGALAAAVPEAFSYAKSIVVLVVMYLAWEQGYMLASRSGEIGFLSVDMSRGLYHNA